MIRLLLAITKISLFLNPTRRSGGSPRFRRRCNRNDSRSGTISFNFGVPFLNTRWHSLPCSLLLLPFLTVSSLHAQSALDSSQPAFFASSSDSTATSESGALYGAGGAQVAPSVKHSADRPFSRLALGADFSPLGVGGLAAVNLTRHLDARVTGNYLQYSTSFNTDGFNFDASLHLASAGASVDYYPFHNGFRLSPGVLFYNQNRANADAPVTPGTSFTLNGQNFYAATPDPAKGMTALSGTGTLNLHTTRPAFTATTGWGNLIPRSGKHWSIPFEIGAAFSGTPALNMSLTGWACYDQAQTECTNVDDPTNPISVLIQSDLKAQVSKWQSNANDLKVYPIISTGIVFNFGIR